MRAVVLYESIYGNTALVARAIGDGLRRLAEVEVRPVGAGRAVADLVVLGAPTHAHGLPSSMSRKGLEKAAADRESHGDALEYHPTSGMRSLVDAMPLGKGARVACFDTRFHRSAILTGSAARTMAKKLRRRGYTVVGEPESFFVVDTEGPLAEGELSRAEEWGASLLAAVPAA